MLNKDSEIIDIPKENFKNNTEEIFELIYTTSHSLLYKMKKDGKYFIVKQNALLNEIGRKILRREYEISIGLNHPNIVNIFEYRYSDDFSDQIVMEYIDGRSLNEFLTEGPSLKERKRIFMELMDAIDYLHKNRIIHNDLKPENILVTKTGDRVKLIDLGLSDDDVNYALKSIGFTKGFSAPELITENKSDIRSDIYSIGKIFRMIFGNKYKGISGKCVRKNPKERFQTIADIQKRWKSLYWRWLLPVILFSVLVFSFFIFIMIEERKAQNQEREELKKEIAVQTRELSEQRESFEVLKNRYETLDDSIKKAEQIKRKIEKDRKEALEAFSGKIEKMTEICIDSLRKSAVYSEIFPIRMRYMESARLLYETQNKIIKGEDLTPQFYSILITEMGKVDKAFNSRLP